MSAHTPGPWHVAYQDKNSQTVVKAEHIEVATCWHHCVGSIEKEMHANARLIAAAPDLYMALGMLMDTIAFKFAGEVERELAHRAMAKVDAA